MYDQVVKCQRAGLCLSEHFLIGKCCSTLINVRHYILVIIMSTLNSDYSLGNEVIKAYDEERDLGVIVSRTLKLSSQYVAAAKSANRILGVISRTFSRTFVHKDSKTMLKLYQSLVRLKLEYCVQAWRPYLQKDIDLLERVQKSTIWLMIKDRNLSYSKRLKRLYITTLETRRLRGNLIRVFKIFKSFDNIQHSDFFTMASTELIGHELKVYKPQVHLDIRKYFFSVRIVNAWNSLPATLLMWIINATMSIFLKENSTVTSRIGDTNKLFQLISPCKPLTLVGGSLSC